MYANSCIYLHMYACVYVCVFTYVEMLYFDVFFQAAWSVGEILTLITLEPHLIVAHFRKIQSNFLKKCYCLRVLTQKVLR